MSVALEASGLGKRYGKRWALEHCSFELPTGSIAGLVGPNGAGKTTLLHIAVGLLEQTNGSIRILGEQPGSASVLPRVGFVAQEMPLYKSFTVDEMISFGAHTNVTFDLPLARHRMEHFEIPLDQRAGSLSGGQRAQLALALAFAKHPDILLLDEPLASLDPLARREFLKILMEGIADSGATVVLSSHLLTDLERVCDHMMVLARGRFRLIADTNEILKNHKVLIGPRERAGAISGVEQVLQQTTTDRQATLLVRTNGPIIDPAWMVNQASLEDVVLSYLDSRSATDGPEPELHAIRTEVAR
ncbi:MAG: ATP-binding cassette domain-containing protein [Actinobacteria bacterium]|nr:MAG: ATP-binding cassette domain-containing protein [Actinomycetota bacterium]